MNDIHLEMQEENQRLELEKALLQEAAIHVLKGKKGEEEAINYVARIHQRRLEAQSNGNYIDDLDLYLEGELNPPNNQGIKAEAIYDVSRRLGNKYTIPIE